MEAPMKYICVLVFLVIMTVAGFTRVDAYGDYAPCGKHDIEKEAEKLAPCTEAAKYVNAPVSTRCCTVMEKKLKNPSCLCAILFSSTASNAGVKPEVSVTIPKRCNIPVRPIGHNFPTGLGVKTPMVRRLVVRLLDISSIHVPDFVLVASQS
ncbi:hypothetical protein REPUB_Repub13aG0088300 [Reevesia pubescens]